MKNRAVFFVIQINKKKKSLAAYDPWRQGLNECNENCENCVYQFFFMSHITSLCFLYLLPPSPIFNSGTRLHITCEEKDNNVCTSLYVYLWRERAWNQRKVYDISLSHRGGSWPHDNQHLSLPLNSLLGVE